MVQRTKGRVRLAAGLTTVIILFCLLLPVGVISFTAGIQGLRFIEQNNAASIGLQLGKLRNSFGLDMPHYGDLLRTANHEVDVIVHHVGDAVFRQQQPSIAEHARRAMRALQELKLDVIAQRGDGWDTSDIDRLELICSQIELDAANGGDNLPELALSLKSNFIATKSNLHGGTIQSFLRELTNPTEEDVDGLRSTAMDYLRPKLLPLTGATGRLGFQLLFGLMILALGLYFFFSDGPAMIDAIQHMLPVDPKYQQELLIDFERTSRAVVLAMLSAAVVQGLTAGIGYAVAGLDYLILLVMLTTVAALIPFVGPMVVWVPVCVYLAFVEERFLAAGLLAAWGLLVVATIDNVVKAAVLHGQSQLHPLLALLSILGGVQTLGPIGIVVGPMAVSLLQTLLGIVRRELAQIDSIGFPNVKQAAAAALGDAVAPPAVDPKPNDLLEPPTPTDQSSVTDA